jgi:phosphate transport system substrate-binding protein
MVRCATLLLATLLSSSACQARPRAALTLSGSTSLLPLAEKWTDAYRKDHPQLAIAVQGGGSTAGVQAAISGTAQIGLVSRALTPSELARARGIEVARDGVVLVVHPSNPLRDVSLSAVRAAYADRIGSWLPLSGRRLPITLITREEGSGTRAAFEALVMGGERIASSALVQDSTGAVRQMVSSDPAALGYISIGLVDASVRPLRLDGVEANERNIDAGRYPLVRPFLFVTRGQLSDPARDFIAWVGSPRALSLLRSEGLLPPRAVDEKVNALLR